LIVLFFFVLSTKGVEGQIKRWEYQRNKHIWETPFPEAKPVAAEFANEDLVVLQEYTEFRVHEYSLNTIIHRRELIQVLSEEGIAKLHHYKLPPEVDPIWERDQGDLQRQVRYQKIPLLGGELVDFGARKKGSGGRLVSMEVRDSVGIRTRTFNSTTEQHYDFYHIFENVEVGDLIEIEYRVFFPFITDRSNESNFTLQTDIYTTSGLFDSYRIFFHGIHAKQEVVFDLVFPSNEHYILFEENDLPKAEELERSSKPYTRRYRWELENLPACLSETGIRPYLDLPFVQFYRHNREYGKWSDFDLLEFRPYDWFLMSRSRMRFKSDHERMFGGVSTEEKILSRFFDARVLGRPDTLSRVLSIHNYINDEMTYKDDSFWYMGIDNRLERMKWHLKRSIFREISRFTIYDGMMNRLGIDYYHAFISDKRIAEIDPAEWKPILGIHRLFAVSANRELSLFYPKISDTGWQLGELPFYLTETATWVVRQNADDRFDPNNVLFTDSPTNGRKKNTRKISADAIFDAEQGGIFFQTQLKLSGQFSTMTRGAYLGERFFDESVNPLYHQRIDEISERTESLQVSLEQISKKKPFEVQMELSYFEVVPSRVQVKQTNEPVEIKSPNELRIPLSNLFPHIYEEEIDAQRDLPYYCDFPQADEICYTFHLPDSATLVNSPTFRMSGDRWSYQFVAIMRDEATLELCSRLLLDREKLYPNEYEEWRKVISFLKLLGEEEIVLTIAVD